MMKTVGKQRFAESCRLVRDNGEISKGPIPSESEDRKATPSRLLPYCCVKAKDLLESGK